MKGKQILIAPKEGAKVFLDSIGQVLPSGGLWLSSDAQIEHFLALGLVKKIANWSAKRPKETRNKKDSKK